MLGRLSPATALAVLSIFVSQVTAFNFSTYGTKQCTGLSVTEVTEVGKGCMKTTGSGIGGIISRWTSEDDNKLLIAMYSDDTCCHANMLDTMVWTPGCTPAPEGFHSWRVLDPSEPDKGKDGETYTC